MNQPNESITWEYARLEWVQGVVDIGGQATLYWPDGTSKTFAASAQGVTLALNEAGAQGWEGVAALGSLSMGYWTLTRALRRWLAVLKRFGFEGF